MIRFGVLGDGAAAQRFLDAATGCSQLEFSVIYSEQEGRAAELARRYGAKKYSCRLQDVIHSEDTDAVYIATPDCLHFDHGAALLSAGKHVLCHNRAADSENDLKELLQLAEEYRVSLAESMAINFRLTTDIIHNELSRLGPLQKASFQYCRYSPESLETGEALTDCGSYCIQPMVQLFGIPKAIAIEQIECEQGQYASGAFRSRYNDLEVDVIYSRISGCRIPSQITGEKGRLVIIDLDRPCQIYFSSKKGAGEPLLPHILPMDYLIKEWLRQIEEPSDQSSCMTASLMRLQVIDAIRAQTTG